MFPDIFMFGGPQRNVSCERCGVQRITAGPASGMEWLSYGKTITIHTVGLCSECYSVFCGQCAKGGWCPKCHKGLMLNPDLPPSPPPWRRLFKRLKWHMVFG